MECRRFIGALSAFAHHGVELAKVEVVPIVSQPDMIVAARQPALSERVVEQVDGMEAGSPSLQCECDS